MLKRSSLILALLFAFTMLPAFGQVGNIINTKIPFPFIVDGKVLPAGQYELFQPDIQQDSEWLIRDVNHESTEVLFTAERQDKMEPRADTYLSFKEVNHKDYLSAIWTVGSVQGWHVPVQLEEGAAGAHVRTRTISAAMGARASR